MSMTTGLLREGIDHVGVRDVYLNPTSDNQLSTGDGSVWLGPTQDPAGK